jgi:hypothetical protein
VRLSLSFDTIALHAPAPLAEGRALQRCCASPRHTTAIPTLALGPPDDAYEREADRVARHVGRAVGQEQGGLAAAVDVRHRDAPTGAGVTAAPGSVTDALRDSGRPLEPLVRRGMEQVFGFDFSHVRIHDGAAGTDSARAVRASAYTLGHHIVFGEGRYSPASAGGRALLAHELTHVVQHGDAAGPHVIRRAPPEEGATQVAPLSPSQVRLGELMSAWIPAEKQHQTTISRAAAIETATGRRVYLIAIAGEGAKVPMPAALLRPDEVRVPYVGGHAELQTMHFAGKNGYQLQPGGLDPSRDFCTNCAWWAAKGGLAPPEARVRVGHESKRLADVPKSELVANLEKRRMPGERGEPTEKGLAKREAAAARSEAKREAADVPTRYSPPDAHETTSLKPGAAGPSHTDSVARGQSAPVGSTARPEIPKPASPMEASKGPVTPAAPESPVKQIAPAAGPDVQRMGVQGPGAVPQSTTANGAAAPKPVTGAATPAGTANPTGEAKAASPTSSSSEDAKSASPTTGTIAALGRSGVAGAASTGAQQAMHAVSATQMAKTMAFAKEAERFRARVGIYFKVYSAYQTFSDVLKAIETTQTVIRTGHALPETIAATSALVTESGQAKSYANAMYSAPSSDALLQLYVLQDAATLKDIAATYGSFSSTQKSVVKELWKKADHAKRLADDAMTTAIGTALQIVHARYETASAVPAVFVSEDLRTIANDLRVVAENYAAAAGIAHRWARDAEFRANLANDMLLAGFHVLAPRCHFLGESCEDEQRGREAGRQMLGSEKEFELEMASERGR